MKIMKAFRTFSLVMAWVLGIISVTMLLAPLFVEELELNDNLFVGGVLLFFLYTLMYASVDALIKRDAAHTEAVRMIYHRTFMDSIILMGLIMFVVFLFTL
jgi:hypothetical protein